MTRKPGVALAVSALVPLHMTACATTDRAIPELVQPVSIGIANPGFEDEGGWECLAREASEYWAPADGHAYASAESGQMPIVQHTGHAIEPGRGYLLTVWARSLNPPGLAKPTPVEIAILADGVPVVTTVHDVSPPRLVGDAQRVPNDDGANVWIDEGYWVEFSDKVMYQRVEDDPIADPWIALNDADYDVDMALGPVITPHGLRGV